MATKIPQKENPTEQIKAAANASSSVPELRQAVIDLADEVERIKAFIEMEQE